MTVPNGTSISTNQLSVPVAKLLRRSAIITGIVSLLAYPTFAIIVARLMPSGNSLLALHILDAVPYGVALSIAAAGVAQQINYRHRAKSDPETKTSDYITGAVVGSIIWIVATIAAIPLTVVMLVISAFVIS